MLEQDRSSAAEARKLKAAVAAASRAARERRLQARPLLCRQERCLCALSGSRDSGACCRNWSKAATSPVKIGCTCQLQALLCCAR